MRKSILGIAFLVFVMGLTMLIAPQTWIQIIVIVLGVFAFGSGLYQLIFVRPKISENSIKKVIFVRGIVSALVGLVAITLPLLLAGTVWTLMLYVLAVYLLLSAISEFIALSQLREAGMSNKFVTTEIITSFTLAILLFVLPGTIAYVLIRIIGVLAILVSVFVGLNEWKNKNTEIKVEVVE